MATTSDPEAGGRRKRFRSLSDTDPVLETSECAVQSIPRRNRRFCPHCKEEVSTKTFKFHKRLYYDKVCHGMCMLL